MTDADSPDRAADLRSNERAAERPQERADAGWDPEGTDLAQTFVSRSRERGAGPGAAGTPMRRRARRTTDEAGWSGAGRDERDPQPLDATVARLVDEHGWGTDLRVHGVLGRWDQLVGADVAAHCMPEQYTGSELTVRTDSTAWATQLRLLAPRVLQVLNAELGEGSVTRIHVVGPAAPSWSRGLRRVKGRGPRDTYG